MSPAGFRSAGEFWLKGKPMEATFCQYEDFVVVPGEYRGTAAAAGEKAYTFAFTAEAGKVYEIIHNGEAAGRNQLVINTIKGDDRAPSDTGGEPMAAAGATAAVVAPAASQPAEAVPAVPAPAQMSAPAVEAPAAPAANKSILPDTGQGQNLKQLPLVLVGLGLVLCMLLAGVVLLVVARQQNVLR
jgi:hypothetical protein